MEHYEDEFHGEFGRNIWWESKQRLTHGDMNSKLLYTMSRMQRKHNVRRKQEVFSCQRREAHTATRKYIGILTSKGQHSALFLVLKMGKIT